MISYAKNNEDVLLQRAFASIDTGYYIDVGGYLPQLDSNTYALYRKGWSGLIIEPLLYIDGGISPRLWEGLRPRDQLIPGLAGKEVGLHPFWTCSAAQMSTGSETMVRLWGESAKIGEPIEVPMYSLNYLLDAVEYKGNIHLLSVDVEGMENEVFAGFNLRKYRPWVVLVECAKPGTREPWIGDWHFALATAEYREVYRDGANAWYLANEHRSLRALLRYPPGAFDNWITARQAELEKRVAQ